MHPRLGQRFVEVAVAVLLDLDIGASGVSFSRHHLDAVFEFLANALERHNAVVSVGQPRAVDGGGAPLAFEKAMNRCFAERTLLRQRRRQHPLLAGEKTRFVDQAISLGLEGSRVARDVGDVSVRPAVAPAQQAIHAKRLLLEVGRPRRHERKCVFDLAAAPPFIKLCEVGRCQRPFHVFSACMTVRPQVDFGLGLFFVQASKFFFAFLESDRVRFVSAFTRRDRFFEALHLVH